MSRIQGVKEKEYKGVKYKSILEADTAEVLDLMGLPIRYEEKTFVLLEGFRCQFQKRMVLNTKYIPDFWVGNIILECKGFETPEWKLKKKLIFKYLIEKEPNVYFYQINKHKWKKDLLQALDCHWEDLGYAIQITSKGSAKIPPKSSLYKSIQEAMDALHFKKNITPILSSLTGKKEFVYDYNWKLVKLKNSKNNE